MHFTGQNGISQTWVSAEDKAKGQEKLQEISSDTSAMAGLPTDFSMPSWVRQVQAADAATPRGNARDGIARPRHGKLGVCMGGVAIKKPLGTTFCPNTSWVKSGGHGRRSLAPKCS